MAGFLVPPWYKVDPLSPTAFIFTNIAWGATLATAAFSSGKAAYQTHRIWRHGRRASVYTIMLWLELSACIIMSILLWSFLTNKVQLSFQLLFSLVCLWTIQIQCLMQIIINRVSMIMYDEDRAERLKWIVAMVLGVLNITIFIIWIPARLQISPTWIHIDFILDRIVKGIFCLVDISLNLYFVYLVKTMLIADGLKKYITLFRWNLAMIFVSLSLDVIIIGMMSLPNNFFYIQFHPFMYLVKLHIEMNMADLIAKLAKANNSFGDFSQPGNSGDAGAGGKGHSVLEGHHQCAGMCNIVTVASLPSSMGISRQEQDPLEDSIHELRG
ncbi:hypothetical protein BKA64DRAFT_687153 [Cadophora sp. MPI-SDFR-AT-0126]|nr:hypothetical protein BKA64DRAFT_687153 [Leotiomycetes sp. MPI-SDFR-AT-0126]